MLNGDGMPAFSTTCCPAPLRVYEIHLPPRVGAFQTGSGFGWITTLAPVRLFHSIRPLRSTPLRMGTFVAVFARTATAVRAKHKRVFERAALPPHRIF